MVIFKSNRTGKLRIIHNYMFHVCSMEHEFELFTLLPSGLWDNEKRIVPEKDWEDYIKSLGEIMKEEK